ncbi:SusC/RagA family TonB-linked outer membrane protein [Pedobacter sp. R-06]|uniref:SusC/RagA family TonB-linked outer membrane protein n=1 Tax=Pedobacter sp. R-06 TaxID=3404051 RepID=UPI003CEB7473
MYKIYTDKLGVLEPVYRKMLLIMRLITIILIASLMQVSASTTTLAQKISLSEKNAAIDKVFNKISQQTGYDFLVTRTMIRDAKPVNITVKDEELSDVLSRIFKDQPLEYVIKDKSVIISRKSFSSASAPQTQTKIIVNGRVVGEDNQVLPGASVKIKGQDRVIKTGSGGEFSIEANEGDIITVSFLGYKTAEVEIGKTNNITINLEVLPAQLDAVTVVSTGYQKLSKERATGAFNTISKAQLDRPSTNIAQRLVGVTPGMQATLDADGNPRFEIRGQTSLNIRDNNGNLTANAVPLVVVDGFPIQGDFSTINPNDVESITILKDAAAASIWGARSGNGVIVITTKRPQNGDALKIELNSFIRLGGKLDLNYVNPQASSAETIDYEKAAFNHWGGKTNLGTLAGQDQFKAWSLGSVAMNEQYLGYLNLGQRDAKLAQLSGYDNQQQISDYLLAAPVNQQYNLSISAATKRSSNVFSLMFADNQSNFKNTNSQQYLLNYRNTTNIFKWLDFDFSAMFQYNDRNNSGYDLNYIKSLSPYDMLLNPDGSQTNVVNTYYQPLLDRSVPMGKFPYSDWTFNPIAEMANRNLGARDLNARLQGGLTVKLLKGLTYDVKGQFEIFNTLTRNLYGEQTFFVRNTVNTASTWNMTTNAVTPNLPKGSILDQSRDEYKSYNIRNQLNFNRSFGRHEISVIAGTEITNRNSQSFGNPRAYGYNDQTLSVGTFPNGPGGTSLQLKDWIGTNETFSYVNTFQYATDRYFSLYGNAAYTFDGKYTVSGSVRTDASNLISDDPSYRYSPFWSAGLSWQLSKEKFLNDITWIDRLGIRMTYGYNGNVDKSTAFMPLISSNPNPDIYTQDRTASIASYGNPTLRWEKIGTANLGIDYSLFGGKIFGKLDLYSKKGKDLIADITIPSANGVISQKFNNAGMLNQGIEVEFGTFANISDKIRWTGSLNFAYNHNEITKLFRASYQPSNLLGTTSAYVEGKNANTLWSYKYAGLFNLGTDASLNWQPMIQGPDAGTRFSFANTPLGNPLNYMVDGGTKVAPYIAGFSSQFRVYDFDFSFIFTGKFGNVFRHNSFNYPLLWAGKVLPNSRLSEVMNADPMTMVPLPKNPNEPSYYNWTSFTPYLDYLVDNASYVRLQEVNLSYNVPVRLLSKFGLARMQLYAQGNNLFIITANKYGEDPEYPIGTVRPQAQYTFGFKLNF